MAHHASSKKRIRQESVRRTRNRFYKKSARTAVKALRTITDKTDAESFLPKVVSMLDKLVKKNNIHKNKAGNLKSSLMKRVASLA